jgi:predicted dienelactone hydrolase
MRLNSAVLCILCLSVLGTDLAGQHLAPFDSTPPIDAPQLAPPGSYDVGYQVISYTDPARPDLAAIAASRDPLASRTLNLHIWYPADLGDAEEMRVSYKGRLPFPPGRIPEGAPTTFDFEGRAAENARPLPGNRYPLVVVSHGYGNWPTFLSYLTENLASKGYVVASIDHEDVVTGDRAAMAFSFGSVLMNRAKDQRFAIERMVSLADGDDPLGQIIDASSVGLIGYSMGGYGAVTSAGAGYDASSPLFERLPKPLLGDILEGSSQPPHPNLKAVVAMAPWGGNPPSRAWTENALASIKVPLFFVCGDADDVSGFEEGIKWIYEKASGSDRRMLIYQNARHNIGGNPPPPVSSEYMALQDWFDEPVWRKERISAINQHFVTAFLDLYLKGDESKRSYVDVAPVVANDGEWPRSTGRSPGPEYSDGGLPDHPYWKGFHRRFAIGLEMHHLSGN